MGRDCEIFFFSERNKHRESVLPAGKINIGLRYDQERFKLIVSVNSATDLVPVEKEGHADPYVTLRLLPVTPGQSATLTKRRKHTQIIQNALNPVFDEQ